MAEFIFVENTFMVPYTKEVADYCDPFSCGDDDLDDFSAMMSFSMRMNCLAKRIVG